MALSCRGVCRGASVVFLYGKQPLGVNASLCTPRLSSTKSSSLWFVQRYSSSQARHGGVLKSINQSYERFLERRFPRFYVLYSTFKKGTWLLFQDFKAIRTITVLIIREKKALRDLPYRDQQKFRQFRRDILKIYPVFFLSLPPFANYVVFLLMYLYPRQVLIPHFWTPQQLVEFQRVYHAQRASHHLAVVQGLERSSTDIKDVRLKGRLEEICSKVRGGVHPIASDVYSLKTLFSGPPLGINKLHRDQLEHLCPLLFLTTRLPSFLIRHRLKTHALELMRLDLAIIRLGVHQLNDSELREACYVRGLNPEGLSLGQLRQWLAGWLQFSAHLKDKESSLYLHCMALLTMNYPKRINPDPERKLIPGSPSLRP